MKDITKIPWMCRLFGHSWTLEHPSYIFLLGKHDMGMGDVPHCKRCSRFMGVDKYKTYKENLTK